MSEIVLATQLYGAEPFSKGKVRDLYTFGEQMLMVSTDRLSAFDVVLPNGVPNKGRVLNHLSAFWFGHLSATCENHLLTADDSQIEARIGPLPTSFKGRCMLVQRCDPLPVECVARQYLTGSLYKEYKLYGSNLYNLDLESNLLEGHRFDQPVFTPATKAIEGHDQNISFEQLIDTVGFDQANRLKDTTLELFRRASEFALKRGFILVDTKFEFGLLDDRLVWIDEALTPDSSRYWLVEDAELGGVPVGYDKQPVRDYLRKIGWNQQPPAPELPEEIVDATRARYEAVFERITGLSLQQL